MASEIKAPPKPKTPEKITSALIFRLLPFCIKRLSTPRILRVILKITIIAMLVSKKRSILCINLFLDIYIKKILYKELSL
jgi:hypothetical protein